MDKDVCKVACKPTVDQSNSKLGHDLKYGRVTPECIIGPLSFRYIFGIIN